MFLVDTNDTSPTEQGLLVPTNATKKLGFKFDAYNLFPVID